MALFPWLRLMEEDEEKMEISKFLPIILDCQRGVLEYIVYDLVGHINESLHI